MSIQLDICSVIQRVMPSVTELAGKVPSTQIAALNGDGDALEQERRFSFVNRGCL